MVARGVRYHTKIKTLCRPETPECEDPDDQTCAHVVDLRYWSAALLDVDVWQPAGCRLIWLSCATERAARAEIWVLHKPSEPERLPRTWIFKKQRHPCATAFWNREEMSRDSESFFPLLFAPKGRRPFFTLVVSKASLPNNCPFKPYASPYELQFVSRKKDIMGTVLQKKVPYKERSFWKSAAKKKGRDVTGEGFLARLATVW